jgi:membrane-associated PAP2 superfamily phosphatase
MREFIEYIKKLFARVEPAQTDEHCPYCHGVGYDSSGYTCLCLFLGDKE